MPERSGQYIPPDLNSTIYSTGHYEQRITVHQRGEGSFIVAEDPMLGSSVINDRLAVDLFTTPLLQRTEGVSQLSKGKEHATISNTAGFNRRAHLIGVYLLNEYFGKKVGLGTQDRMAVFINAGVDDAAHGPYSHATDIAIEDNWGGEENYHQYRWRESVHLGGVEDVLSNYDISLDKQALIPNVEIPKWFESSHPDINLDRLQYTVGELLFWFDHDGSTDLIRERIRQLAELDRYAISNDGYLAFKDVDTARLFAKGYMLLVTEHWNDPVNRVQLHLLIQGMKRAVLERRLPDMYSFDNGETRQFEDYMYYIDADVMSAMETGPMDRDDMMYTLHNLLVPIAFEERRRVQKYKLPEFARFMDDDRAVDYPSELLKPKRVDYGPPSSQVNIRALPTESLTGNGSSKVPELQLSYDGVAYSLPPLKNRFVDPLVSDSRGGFTRLTELDPYYAKLLVQQQEVRATSVTAEFALTKDYVRIFHEGVKDISERFKTLGGNYRMTSDQKRRSINRAARKAIEASMDNGTYVEIN